MAKKGKKENFLGHFEGDLVKIPQYAKGEYLQSGGTYAENEHSPFSVNVKNPKPPSIPTE